MSVRDIFRRTSSRRRDHGSVASLAASAGAGTLFGLVAAPLLARSLGPTGRGELAAVLVYGSLATTLLAFGVPNAVTYHILTSRTSSARVLGGAVKFALFGLPVALIAAVFVFFGPLRSLSTPGRLGASINVLLAPLGVFSLCLTAVLRAQGDLRAMGRVRLLPLSVNALAVVIFWLAGRLTIHVAVVLSLSSVLISAFACAHAVGIRPSLSGPVKPLLVLGARSAPGGVASAASFRLDQAVLASILPAAALGQYSIAATVAVLPFVLTSAVSDRVVGAIGSIENREARADAAAAYIRRTILVTGALCLLLAFLLPVGIPLVFGSEFSPALPAALLLLAATVFMGGVASSESVLVVLGLHGRAAVAQVVGTGVALVGLLVLVGPFGILGAALATTLDFATTYLFLVAALRRADVRKLTPTRRDMTFVIGRVRKLSRL